MQIKLIPDDVNIEILLPELSGMYHVSFNGTHKRNSYKDIYDLEESSDGVIRLVLSRNSIYNSLPEFMFHSIDRFGNLPKLEEKELFARQYEMQEREKNNAYAFFAPIDILLLLNHLKVREKLQPYTDENKVLIDALGDRMTDEQKNNRFVRHLVHFLPSCKNIRGNKTLLTLMLRKVLFNEGLRLDAVSCGKTMFDDEPRYCCSLGDTLDYTFVGNTYCDNVILYKISYWPEGECDEHFLCLVGEVEVMRRFVQDYFMSVEELLSFEICKDEEPLRLSDEYVFNYLNYNTNI